jgi:pimeloyl-ACP methyl ester carboxylesterase
MAWLAKDMASQGYRVLTYDLYGRGHSDNAVGSEHTPELFVHQINELLEALGCGEKKFVLVGYSMGGAVATIYTAQYGHRVDKLILIAPAGMPLEFPLAAKIGNLPYIGELFTGNSFFKNYFTATAKESFVAPHIESEFAEYIVGLSHYHVSKENFFAALLSTLRHFPLNNAAEFYERVGVQRNIPVLFLWGTHDQMVPYSGAEKALEFIPHAELVTLDNAGHAALLENCTVVDAHILEFLSRDDCDYGRLYKNITYIPPATFDIYNLVETLSF